MHPKSRFSTVNQIVEEIHKSIPIQSVAGESIRAVVEARRRAIVSKFPSDSENGVFAEYLSDRKTSYEVSLLRDESLRIREQREKWLPIPDEDLIGGALYPIRRLSSDGGTSEVWLAESSYWEKTLVVKYLSPKKVNSRRDRIALALAEARKIHGFSHPNVVKISSVGYLEGSEDSVVPYIAMEHLEGSTLAEWRDGHAIVTVKEAAAIAAVILDALSALHAFEPTAILCLDLKPSNVMIVGGPKAPADANTIKLIDFGSPTSDSEFRVESEGYVAPERADPTSSPSPSWDIYAVGGILYYLITGKNPSGNPGTLPILLEQQFGDSIFRAILLKALAPRPAERYQSAKEMADDLRAWSTDHPVRNAGLKYSKKELNRLLIRRCATTDDAQDHSLFVSKGFAWTATAAFSLSTLSYVLTLFGVDPNLASWCTLVPFNTIVLAILGRISVITHFQSASLRVLMYSVAYTIGYLLFAILVCKGKPENYGGFQTILTSLLTVWLGLSTPLWKWWNLLGWGFLLVLTPIAIWAGEQSWYPPLYPIFQGWQIGILYLVFMAEFSWQSEKPTA